MANIIANLNLADIYKKVYLKSIGINKYIHMYIYIYKYIVFFYSDWRLKKKFLSDTFLQQHFLLLLLGIFSKLLIIFIVKGFWTIVFIFIISTTFWPICPQAFFRCLLNMGTYTEFRTTSFIESTGVSCFNSISHNHVQVLSIPVLLLACSQDWTCNLQRIVSLEA